MIWFVVKSKSFMYLTSVVADINIKLSVLARQILWLSESFQNHILKTFKFLFLYFFKGIQVWTNAKECFSKM